MRLPSLFEDRMRQLLGAEFQAFAESYERERAQGLRINLLKVTDPDLFAESSPFHLRKIPWTREGFYYDAQTRPGRHPYHEAGVYYIQEPSAMAVVELLDPRPGDCVLDLCAAPGGKTSHIASRLKGEGFLLSNEIHPSRAKILSQNVERMGVVNAVVTNEESGRLADYFPEFFDRVVVDAPCSGEGMFRKDENARFQWSVDQIKLCSERQQGILNHAARMLKAGGRLVYSTCTFAPEEDEQTVEKFLEDHGEFALERAPRLAGLSFGEPSWSVSGREDLAGTVRIWPHRSEGEGHYIAVLKKIGEGINGGERPRKRPRYLTESSKEKVRLRDFHNFCAVTLMAGLLREELLTGCLDGRRDTGRALSGGLTLFGEQLYLLPGAMVDFSGLKVVRPGLHLGTFKKNRFEPSHALALALREDKVRNFRRFSSDSMEIAAYLRGEAFPDPGPCQGGFVNSSGWLLVTVDGYTIGWAKLSGGILKNHYPKGLRRSAD